MCQQDDLGQNNVAAGGKLRSARCSLFVISKALAARKTKLITARARRNIRNARMLASTRKDHSVPLLFNMKTLFYLKLRISADMIEKILKQEISHSVIFTPFRSTEVFKN